MTDARRIARWIAEWAERRAPAMARRLRAVAARSYGRHEGQVT